MNIKNASILIIDDDPDILTAVRLLLKTESKEVFVEKNPEQILQLLGKHFFDLILLDMNFKTTIQTGNEGIYWLRKIKALQADAFVIMITAYGDIDLAVRSLKEGASDFIIKPWHNEKLLSAIKEALDKKSNPKTTKSLTGVQIIGQSEAMKNLLTKMEKIAPTDANVLILGENGTGKDLIAQAIHEKSLRKQQPFVKVDLGALTESLFETELFGHKKGAFTDAREERIGRFEHAHKGTLFLDEIGNISLTQQAKLLTVLQNRMVTRIGANEGMPIDIRLICATNLSLGELANENRFRKDLIYRINTIELFVPPLRERDGDILLLAQHYARIYAEKYLKPTISFDKKAVEKLVAYPFPGNVRELQYAIERAIIMADHDVLLPEDLLFSPIESMKSNSSENADLNLSNVERSVILKVIEKHQGNISKAARELGLTRTALYRRLNKYDI